METEDARKLPPAAQEALRRRAVAAVLEGKSKTEVAALFGISRTALTNWVKRYEEQGEKSLAARKRGRPKGGQLAGWQAANVVRLVTDKCPDQIKMPFALWTREAVGQLIEERFGIKMSVWTVGRYLKRWGFSPQKPLRRAYEQNPEVVQQWLREDYPAIKAEAESCGAEIHWGDEMGVRSDYQAGRSFARVGQTPVVKGTGQRFGCSMISAITNRGKLAFMVFENTFTTDVFLEFLRRLVRHAKRQIFLIVDRHPVHRAQAVQEWLTLHQEEIRLFHLPPYSPELNPDELLNHDTKVNAIGRRRPRTKTELMTNLRSHLRGRQRTPHIVQRFFREPHVRYAA